VGERRFTRLSNGFSRKKKNLNAALALYFVLQFRPLPQEHPDDAGHAGPEAG